VLLVFIAAAAGVYDSATKEDKKNAQVLKRRQNIINSAIGLPEKTGENLVKAVAKHYTDLDLKTLVNTAEGRAWFLKNVSLYLKMP
jgi:hypothetical protein